MRFPLDTNACISHLRSGGTSLVSQRMANAVGDIAVSAITREELVYGALRTNRRSQSLAEIHAFCALFPSFPFDDDAADLSATIRAQLEGVGRRIEFNDVLIAAVALSNGLILITHNVRHFSRVQDLLIEDWESAP